MGDNQLFLQTDPIPGGSANNYDYCNQDPINCYDLNGTFWSSGVLKKTTHFAAKHWKQAVWIAAGTLLVVAGGAFLIGVGGLLFETIAASEGLETIDLIAHAGIILAPAVTLSYTGGYIAGRCGVRNAC